MIPRFGLVRPRSLDEALEAFAAAGGEGGYVAGGTELLQVMKMGLAGFTTLIDLKAIPELHGISETDAGVRIGAATSHRDIERSDVVARRLPSLAGLERHVANVRVRNQGTIGGNLAFAEPHSDPATFLLAAGASIELIGPNGARTLAVDEFVLGPLTTAREPDEILAAVEIPGARAGEGRGYAKIAFFERPAVSIGVQLSVADGAVADARLAVGSAVESPTVVEAAGAAMIGAPIGDGPAGGRRDADRGLEEALDRCRDALTSIDAVPDLNGSADYKRHLAGVLAARAVRDAIAEARADA